MKTIILIIILFAVCSPALACEDPENDWAYILKSRKHTLKGPFTIKEMESNNLVEIYGNGKSLPFGNQNKEWVEMKNMYKSGDELYSVVFTYSRKSIEVTHFLVRGSCVIKTLIVAVS
jgi:hypothetical protein